MELLEEMPHREMEAIRSREIELEKELLIPRERLLLCLKNLLEQGKDVYIISDMYLPMSFYIDVLRNEGIAVSDDHILLSSERDANKANGTLWSFYAENIVKGRRNLALGLYDLNGNKKPGYEIYKNLGTPGEGAAKARASEIIGMDIDQMISQNIVWTRGGDGVVQ